MRKQTTKDTAIVEEGSSESDCLSRIRQEGKDTERMNAAAPSSSIEHPARSTGMIENNDDGYAADVEEDAWKEPEDEPVVYPSTFAPRQKRRLPSVSVSQDEPQQQQKSTSLELLSTFLVQYKQQNATHEREELPLKKRHKSAISNKKKKKETIRLPQISCRHVCLEEAIAFSPLARIVLQAEPPHAVVHANAAYARMMCCSESSSQEEYHHHHHHHSLMNACQNAFGGMTNNVQLTMYPVCETRAHEQVSTITHYMIEARYTSDSSRDTEASLIPCLDGRVQIVG
jgi:hypothetical protein